MPNDTHYDVIIIGSGAGGNDNDVGRVALDGAAALDDDPGDLAPRRARLQPQDVGVGEQGDVGVCERRVDAERLRVRLRLHQAGEAVARRAADAGAAAPVALVEPDAERHVERLMS